MKPLTHRCVLFCEHIRHEVGGRVSLLGVLGNRLFVQETPLVFPQFCLFVEWDEIDGEIPITLQIVFADGSEPKNRPQALLKGHPGLVARSMVVLNNFAFPVPGPTTFRFLSGDRVIGETVLTIEKLAPAASTVAN